jgi:hypothetical protein
MNLLTKVRQFEESGSLTPAQLKKLRSLEAQGMRTVSNAVQLAEALHPGSFELTKQAADQLARFSVSDAKDQYFAQEIYSSLISLWHILWAPDAPVIREQKQILFKQLSGLEIAFDETPVTREKLRAQKERTFLYGDKEFVAWPHIKLSNSRRIYFAIDTENRRTLIFSWPEHLWTQVDGSSK